MQMKFEEALKRIEEIVGKLEQGDVSLDDSLKLYEEGQSLIKFCREKLTKVEEKVRELVHTEKGDFKLKDTRIEKSEEER
ncbi:exodeoxyribonuclease VII small subunit [candidate division WOR-3 bacterium]|nr:exodeoxyribonuclease VII small subunit [candidate division WOR-3 bacterium]